MLVFLREVSDCFYCWNSSNAFEIKYLFEIWLDWIIIWSFVCVCSIERQIHR